MSVETKTSGHPEISLDSHPEVVPDGQSEGLLLQLFPDLTQYSFNAKKVMDLILQLAVQGKLTASWRASHPELVSGSNSATALLEKIKIEKEKLIAEKKIKKEKPLSPIAEDEKPYELLNNWQWVRLGEVGDWGAGATPSRSVSSFYGGTLNWFKSGELNNGIIDYDSSEKITEEAVKKRQ